MRVDNAPLLVVSLLLGPGTNISDEDIDSALRNVEERYQIAGVSQSKDMRRLARSWCDGLLGFDVSNDKYAQLAKNAADAGHDLIGIRSEWFMILDKSVVFDAMCQIRTWVAEAENPDALQRSLIQRMQDQLNDRLALFDPSVVEAFKKLREAACLLGLPPNYYTSRHIEYGKWLEDVHEFETGITNSLRLDRTPQIESISSHWSDPDSCLLARERVAHVAEIFNLHDGCLKHVGVGGKHSFERWAIRFLWAGITDAFKVVGSRQDIVKPWVTVSGILDLCGVSADPEMVRKTIKRPGHSS